MSFYKHDVSYKVLLGGETVMETPAREHTSQLAIPRTVQQAIPQLLLDGRPDIVIQGDDGTTATIRLEITKGKRTPGYVPMLASTKWLLLAEIDNDFDTEATLADCQESLANGYSPDPDDKVDMQAVANDIDRLIKCFGPDTLAETFVTDQDWTDRASGYLQKKARQGE